jgi:uncharacterized SAM-binding protein YcdF (DUF218 family)
LNRIFPFLSGLLIGAIGLVAAIAVLLLFLPRFLVVTNEPTPADAVIVLGGDSDGSRLRRGVELVDAGRAPRLILVGGSRQGWLGVAKQHCPDCRLAERQVAWLEDSIDTRTDAQLSLAHGRQEGLQKVLVVTSPYHSRRAQFVFNDLFAGSGIETVLLSSGGYGQLIPPDGRWWRDRTTLETVWLEFGKILYWELTPFMALHWDGEGG